MIHCIPNLENWIDGGIIKRHVLLDEGIAGSEPNTVSLRREIAVLDENDNPPVYHGRPYAARVPESAHVGGLLVPPGTITITDRDGGVNADVHVECVSASRDDDVCDVFNVSTEKVESCNKIDITSNLEIDEHNYPSSSCTLPSSHSPDLVIRTFYVSWIFRIVPRGKISWQEWKEKYIYLEIIFDSWYFRYYIRNLNNIQYRN